FRGARRAAGGCRGGHGAVGSLERRGPFGARPAPAADLPRAAPDRRPGAAARAAGPDAPNDGTGPRGLSAAGPPGPRPMAEPGAVLLPRGAGDAADPGRPGAPAVRREARRGAAAADRRGLRRRGGDRRRGAGGRRGAAGPRDGRPGPRAAGEPPLLRRAHGRGDRRGVGRFAGGDQPRVGLRQGLGAARAGPSLTPAMDAARWRVAKGLLQAALDLPAAERSAFLDASCRGDGALRAEVAALLEAHAASGDRFERSPVATARRAAEAAGEVAPPERLGPYRVLRELGRGGMGTVYLAEREGADFRQRVAIKLIHRGMDSDAIVRRFRTERRILAGLDHPNIAQLFDGGTTGDGLPYFVMEHVDGEPIDRWCAAHGSSIDQRLQLFRQVCAAVHYAHQNLVVH